MRDQHVGGRTGRGCCARLGIMNDREGWHRLVVVAGQDKPGRLVQHVVL